VVFYVRLHNVSTDVRHRNERGGGRSREVLFLMLQKQRGGWFGVYSKQNL
jgi:hypothetical protein